MFIKGKDNGFFGKSLEDQLKKIQKYCLDYLEKIYKYTKAFEEDGIESLFNEIYKKQITRLKMEAEEFVKTKKDFNLDIWLKIVEDIFIDTSRDIFKIDVTNSPKPKDTCEILIDLLNKSHICAINIPKIRKKLLLNDKLGTCILKSVLEIQNLEIALCDFFQCKIEKKITLFKRNEQFLINLIDEFQKKIQQFLKNTEKEDKNDPADIIEFCTIIEIFFNECHKIKNEFVSVERQNPEDKNYISLRDKSMNLLNSYCNRILEMENLIELGKECQIELNQIIDKILKGEKDELSIKDVFFGTSRIRELFEKNIVEEEIIFQLK